MSYHRAGPLEDDDAGREPGLYNLRKADYLVDGTRDGADGLARFDPERPALVVTDVKTSSRTSTPFYSGDAQSTGIDLSIAARIAQAHRRTVGADNARAPGRRAGPGALDLAPRTCPERPGSYFIFLT